MAGMGSSNPRAASVGHFSFENLEYEADVDYELLCPICREPMLEPMITRPCQHVFCSTCLRNAFSHQGQQHISHHCPSCRTEFIITDPGDDPAEMYAEPLANHKDNDLPNRLDILRVRCPNQGCHVVRERFLLPDHVENHCAYTVFPCYDQACSQSVERRHMRLHCTHELIECRHCHEWLERFRLPDHEGSCPQLESTCANCKTTFSRNEIEAHRATCEPPKFECRGSRFGCQAVLSDAADLAQHQLQCTIHKLGEVISQQEDLLQAHREALMSMTRKNADLGSRLEQIETDLQQERDTKAEFNRMEGIEQQLESQQQLLNDRISAAELTSFNSTQRQGQFNQYMEACLARIQTDIGAMHNALIRGRMFPGPMMPMPPPKIADVNIPRPGSEGSETVGRPINNSDDFMPAATRTLSATESVRPIGLTPEVGPFASLASILPHLDSTGHMPVTQQSTNGPRPNIVPRRRRSSEERSVKL